MTNVRVLAFGVAAAMVAVAGCARQSATTLSTESASTGISQDGRSAQAGGGETFGGADRIPPKQFNEAPQLSDIHFEFDAYDIKPDQTAILDANAAWLQKEPRARLLIEGHCDERGTDAYNVALGDRRAKAAMNYLVSHGVAGRRISTISYGEQHPICQDHTEDCWAKNRRAHFLIKPQ